VDLSTSRLLIGGVLAALVALPAPATAGFVAPQQSDPVVSCTACIVVDDTGRVLWARAAHRRLPNASTTKMVTALEVVARSRQSEVALVSAEAASVGGGGLDLQAGDEMTVRNLLFAMLLSSSNESAAALAEHVAPSQEAFVRAMNARARFLGTTDTHFMNPHGLDATGHYSSAADLALIGAAVLDRPLLADIVATPSTSIMTPRGAVVEENRNVLLEGYPGAIGVKTGRTIGAGNVLVAAATRGDRTVIAVAMHSTDAANDAAQLLDFGFARIERLDTRVPLTLLLANTDVGSIVFDPSGATSVVAASSIRLDLPPGTDSFSYTLRPASVTAPLEAGERVGTVSVSVDGRELGEVDAVAVDDVDRSEGDGLANALGTLMAAVATLVSAVT